GQPAWRAPQGGGNNWPGYPPGGPVGGWPAASPGGPPYGQPMYVAPPKPGVIPLRPLQFGEILDGSFQTIRRNAASMFGSALIVQALGAVVVGVISVLMVQMTVSLESVD